MAQVKFGNNPTVMNPNSLVELESTNKGFLFPRMPLTMTTSPAPLLAHVQGMTVFNTATVNDVTPGLYYNDGTKWVSLSTNLTGAWKLVGNTGTTAGTNFIGTTDNVDLIFKINNVPSGWINSAINNTSFGFTSMKQTSTGDQNTAVGSNALTLNDIGTQNSAVGAYALQNNTSGFLNTAVGTSALQYNSFGGLNTAMGVQSLQTNFDGKNNTAIGYIAMAKNVNGNSNTALGSGALTETLADNNTAVGYNAGNTLTTGNNNIVIGSGAQPSAPGVSNEVTIGNAANTTYRIYAAASWTYLSDKNAKHNIKELPVGLDFVMGLNPVEFVYNNSTNQTKTLGFVAQDVKQNMEQNNLDNSYGLVSKFDEKNLGLKTDEIIPILVKAMQEQQKIIEAQNKKIEKLEKLLLEK